MKSEQTQASFTRKADVTPGELGLVRKPSVVPGDLPAPLVEYSITWNAGLLHA